MGPGTWAEPTLTGRRQQCFHCLSEMRRTHEPGPMVYGYHLLILAGDFGDVVIFFAKQISFF